MCESSVGCEEASSDRGDSIEKADEEKYQNLDLRRLRLLTGPLSLPLQTNTKQTKQSPKMGNVASAAASSGHSGGPPAAGSLSEAAANGDVAAITAILSGAGKDAAAKLVNAADGDGWTSVHFASYGGSAPALSLLLAAGGDPGKQDRGGRAPLSLAALRGNLACAAALLKSGSGSGDKNKKGSGSSGASLLSARDAHGMQATHKAAVAGQAPMLELLLKLGADPDAAASDGSTPAHMAAYKGHVDALRTLLVPGPGKSKVGNALARRKDGLSVLAEAAAHGQEAAVSFLLSLPGVPASVAETDRSGATAMDLAAARGHSRVVAELRRSAGLPPADSSSSSASALAPAAPAAAGGGAYPSLYQGGGGAAAAAAPAEQPAPAAQHSWWQQAVSATTGATAAAAPAAAAVDPQAASDWWNQAIGREPSELPPPPAAAVVAEKSESGSKKEGGGGGLLDDRKAFEAAALAKAQGIYRALAGKNKSPAAGAGAAPSASASAAAAAVVSSSKQPAAREEKYDLEPYDSDDYEEEAAAAPADAEGERCVFLFEKDEDERRSTTAETKKKLTLFFFFFFFFSPPPPKHRRAPPAGPHRPRARGHHLEARPARARRRRGPRLEPRRLQGRRQQGRPRRARGAGAPGEGDRLFAAAARRGGVRGQAGDAAACGAPRREDAARVCLPDHSPSDARARRRRRRRELRALGDHGLLAGRKHGVAGDWPEARAPGADAERGARGGDLEVHELSAAEVLWRFGFAEPQAPPAAGACVRLEERRRRRGGGEGVEFKVRERE